MVRVGGFMRSWVCKVCFTFCMISLMLKRSFNAHFLTRTKFYDRKARILFIEGVLRTTFIYWNVTILITRKLKNYNT